MPTRGRALPHHRFAHRASPITFAFLFVAAPLSAQSLYDQAQSARRRGQSDSAWELIQRAAESEPDRAEVQFLLGDIACDRASRASAFSAFALARKCKAGYARAAALAPDSTEYVASLAAYLFQAPGIVGGDKDSAQKLVTLVRARDEVRGVFLQAGLWRTENAAAKERADSVVDALGKAHQDDRATQFRVAEWFEQNGLPDRALPVYQALAAHDPGDPVVRFFVGREMVLLKRSPREAQENLRVAAAGSAPAVAPNVFTFAPGAPWYRLGQAYEQLGMSDSARLCFEQALRINPQLGAARRSLDSLTHH